MAFGEVVIGFQITHQVARAVVHMFVPHPGPEPAVRSGLRFTTRPWRQREAQEPAILRAGVASDDIG